MPSQANASPLDAFLKADDLDDLLRVRQEISTLTLEEADLVASVLRHWTDRQAVVNLLFHPDLIPASLRFEALDRALHSNDDPYFALAATVGLGAVELNEVPDDKRAAWLQALQQLVRSKSKVLAGRASVTLFGWAQSVGPYDVLPELLSFYPVPSDGACRNIIAAVLAKYGELAANEFDQRVSTWRLPSVTRVAVQGAYDKYQDLKTRDKLRAMIMLHPTLDYIPNLSDPVAETWRSPDGTAGQNPRKSWWRFW